MKFKSYFLMGLSILMLLTVAGCSTNNSADNADQKSVNKTLVVKGHNFKGTHRGNNTAKDPDYKYSMYFGKDGNFVQDIISSKGFAGRFTEKGTYTIAKNGDITMNIDSVTEERFASDSALRTKQAPLSIVQRQGNSLNAAEDHAIKIENKQTYLLGTVNQVKLYSTDKQTVNYKEHYQTEIKKYDKKYTKLSGRGFMSPATEMTPNGIAFKGNKFIWKYGAPNTDVPTSGLDQGAQKAILVGTYKVENNKLTLFVDESTNLYCGTVVQLGENRYSKYYSSKVTPKVFVFSFTKNSTLSLISNYKNYTSEDMLDYGTVNGTPNYSEWSKSEFLKTFNSSMKKGQGKLSVDEGTDSNTRDSSSKVESVFPSANDFADWVTNYYRDKGDYATDDDPGFHVLNASSNVTVAVRKDENTIDDANMVYSLLFSLTSLNGDNETPDVGRIICISSDGKIYKGTAPMFDDELTSAYENYTK